MILFQNVTGEVQNFYQVIERYNKHDTRQAGDPGRNHMDFLV